MAPDIKNKNFNFTADVNLPTGNENGVIASDGGSYGGWAFYLRDGFLVYHYNYFGESKMIVDPWSLRDQLSCSNSSHNISQGPTATTSFPRTGSLQEITFFA